MVVATVDGAHADMADDMVFNAVRSVKTDSVLPTADIVNDSGMADTSQEDAPFVPTGVVSGRSRTMRSVAVTSACSTMAEIIPTQHQDRLDVGVTTEEDDTTMTWKGIRKKNDSSNLPAGHPDTVL